MISGSECREIAERLRRFHRRDGESQLSFVARMVYGKERVTAADYVNLPFRLANLIDRPACHNVYDEHEMGACANGFECSVCGNRVEDYEHYCITGTFNYCPKCGREVVDE